VVERERSVDVTALDTAAFLAAAPERWRVLDALRDDAHGPASLADDLSLSRRTVQRHLGSFADRDWARKRDGAYHLTATGELVARTHEQYLDSLSAIDGLQALYAHVDDPATAPDPAWLADANLETASPEHPQAPVQFYVERVRNVTTDTVRMVSPVLSRLYHDAHAELAKAGAHTELVLPADAVARAREENPIEFHAILALGVLDLYETTASIGLGFTATDDRVLVCAYDDDGHLAACLETTDERVLSWARTRFDEHLDAATQVRPPGPSSFGR
jgi:predicted transcriptional regulator